MIEHRQIFVNGKWIDSAGTDTIPVVNPATEETIATVVRGTAEDVDLAARAAAAAFDHWSQTSVEERIAVLHRMFFHNLRLCALQQLFDIFGRLSPLKTERRFDLFRQHRGGRVRDDE